MSHYGHHPYYVTPKQAQAIRLRTRWQSASDAIAEARAARARTAGATILPVLA